MDGSHPPRPAPTPRGDRETGAEGAAEDGSSRPEPPRPAAGDGLLTRLLRRFRDDGTPTAEPARDEPLDAVARRAAPGERAMLLNVIRMRDQRVEGVMVPRADIVAAPETATLDELIRVFRDASLTRVPVFRETLDDPLGFVHLKDLAFEYGFNGEESRARFDLRRHLRPLLYVPPSMPTAKLLERMQTSRKHMALVIDEYGGVDGLATIEDLVEQIVGDIEDEHDDADPKEWRNAAPGVWACAARADVAEFEAAAGVRLATEDMEEVDTLGGLVFMLANRVPERGEVIAHPDGHEFEVTDADPRRIKRLRVTLAGAARAAAE